MTRQNFLQKCNVRWEEGSLKQKLGVYYGELLFTIAD
jgi:hypothetical protein